MYFRPTFVLLLALLPLLALSAPAEDQKWEQFKVMNRKHYTDKTEDQKRHELFVARAKKIAKHNEEYAQGKHSYSLELNSLADRTEEELSNMLGAILPSEADLQAPTPPEQADRQTKAMIDLRTDPCLSPIKNQDECGSCWSFAAVNSMEYAYCKKNSLSSPVILSEQNLVDCVYTRDGCQGGFYTNAWQNVYNIQANATYPYVSGPTKTWNPPCKYNSAKQVTRVKTFNKLSTVSEMEQALNNGPLAVALFVIGDKFNYYKSGIYSDTVSCNPQAINTTINHAVNLVGYNNNNNPPYWILRNSWDTTWGINGYMTIQKGINLCNIESFAYGNVQMV